MIRVLNAYGGLGGNRKCWGKEFQVTTVELDKNIASIYKNLYPNDTIVTGDAHDYILNNFDKFDFIWSSPPCQTHSSFRQNLCVRFRGTKPVYPDMKLWQEIIFLTHNFKGKWVVENVKPYYKPLIEPVAVLQRHFFWSNFEIGDIKVETDCLRTAQIPQLQEHHKVDLSSYKIKDKRQLLRNCVHYELGEHIIKEAYKERKGML